MHCAGSRTSQHTCSVSDVKNGMKSLNHCANCLFCLYRDLNDEDYATSADKPLSRKSAIVFIAVCVRVCTG